MATLSSGENLGIGALEGVEIDEHNSRDKGGNLTEVQDEAEDLETLARDFHHGQGVFESRPDDEPYLGFENTGSQRGVFRVLLDRQLVDGMRPQQFPADLSDGYSLEAAVPVDDESYLGWIGTLEDSMERPPESHATHRMGELMDAIESSNTATDLPERYEHEFPEEVSRDDRERTQELWNHAFDGCYVTDIDMELVDWYYSGEVLPSIIRDSENEGEIVSTAAAEYAVVDTGTYMGELELVELSEFATDSEHQGEGLGAYNGQRLLEEVQDHGVDAVYSQNTAAQPAMTAIATNLGAEYGGILRSHANVANPSQDLVLTWFPGDEDGA